MPVSTRPPILRSEKLEKKFSVWSVLSQAHLQLCIFSQLCCSIVSVCSGHYVCRVTTEIVTQARLPGKKG